MAEQPKYFDIEDYETGKLYRVEAYADDATYDEAVQYFSSLPETEWSKYEVKAPKQQKVSSPKATPAVAPKAVAPVEKAPKGLSDQEVGGILAKAGKARAGDYQLKVDSLLDPDYQDKEMTEQEKRQYLALINNPNVSREQVSQFAQSIGRDIPDDVWSQIEAGRKSGNPFAAVSATYQEKLEELIPQEFSSVEGLFETGPEGDGWASQFGRSFSEEGQFGSTGIFARRFNDWMDTGGDIIDKKFPNLSPEDRENLQEAYVAYLQKAVRQGNERAVKDDSLIPWLAAKVVAPDAADLFGLKGAKLGSTAARVVGKGIELGTISAAADVGYQAADIYEDVQDEYSIEQTALSGLTGALLGAGAQGVGEGLDKVISRRAGDVAPPAERAPIVVPEADGRTKSYKKAVAEAREIIVEQVNELTNGWTNAPDIEVYENFKNLKGVDNTAIGVYTTKTLEDGTTVPVININTASLLRTAKKRKVTPESLVEAVTFHESLGHHGLLSVFENDLETFLDDIYTNGDAKFRKEVDDWLSANPSAYGRLGETRRRIFATEEVLAEASEKGPITRSKLDSLANYIKDFARTRLGINLKYSQREIRSYLAVAHDRTMHGQKTTVSPDVVRNMGDVIDLGARRSDKELKKFHAQFMKEVKEKSLKFSEMVSKLREEGELPLEVGSRILTPKAKETGDGPWKIAGYYVDTKNPLKYGYRVERGEERGILSVSDPEGDSRMRERDSAWSRKDEVNSWQVMSGPQRDLKYMRGEDEIKIRNDINYQDLKKSIRNRKAEFSSYKIEVEKIRDDLDQFEGEIDLDDSPAMERLEEIIENSEILIDRYESLFQDPDKQMDYRVEKDLREILDDAYFVNNEATVIYNAAILPSGANDNPFNPFRPTPRVGEAIFSQGNASDFPELSGLLLSEEDIFYTQIYDVANDKYMRGDRKTPDEGDFERRMTNILEEIRDAYVPTERSQAEARRAASLAGLRSRQYKSEKGLDDLDVRLFQYDAVNDRYQEKLLRITEKMENPKDANEYVTASDNFKKTLYEYKLLAAKIQGDQAQIGRALNAMKALNLTKRKISDTLGLLDDTFKNKTEAEAFAALDDPEVLNTLAKLMSEQIRNGNTLGAAKIAEKVGKPYWWQYVLSYLHNSMLSGLGTHAVNAYDAVNVLGRKLEERVVGGAIGQARKKLGAKDAMTAMEGVGFTYGILRALVDVETYRNTYRAFKEGYEFQPFDARIERQDARIPGLSRINDLLYASDMFWRSFHMSANLYSLGIRKAYKEGFKGKQLFEEGYANAINADKDLMDEAKLHADEALLVDSPSAITSWIEAGKNIKPNMSVGQQVRAFTLNLLFPFLRVSDRLVFQALKRVPLVAFLDHNTRREWSMGGAARDAVMARQMMGAALLSYYWMQADPKTADEEGYIEGYGDPNYQKTMALESTGYRAETVTDEEEVMRNANQINITANPFNTQNNLAVLVASIRQGWEKSKKEDKDANEVALLLASAMRAGGSFIMKQGYADNVTPYVQALKADPQQETSVANAVGEVATRAVPALVRQLNQMYFDPIKRDTTGDKSFEDRVLGRVQAGIPGLSNLLPANVTALGDEQEHGRTLLRLGDGTPIKQGDPYTELRKLEREIPDPVLTEFRGSFTFEGQNIKLNAVEKNKWQAIQGQYLKEAMLKLVVSPEWKAMSSEEKQELIKDAKIEAYDYTKEELLPEILQVRGLAVEPE